MNDSNREQNEFNNAMGFIQRLDKIFYLIAESKVETNINYYIKSLRLLFHELSTDMTSTERDNYKKKLRKLEEEYSNQRNNNNIIPKNLFYDLEDVELDLRSIYSSSGLQNKKKDDFLDSDEQW